MTFSKSGHLSLGLLEPAQLSPSTAEERIYDKQTYGPMVMPWVFHSKFLPTNWNVCGSDLHQDPIPKSPPQNNTWLSSDLSQKKVQGDP